ncbi:WASP homolog-associated protein with actin, membranes and microtubules [Tamandua tetradactyla]|uniref:WASP homolog-associated protein with actin, membranes and microtubules n=1 Tax=Tamandua tetradactyla TaxID=48850 RepID=UPI0040542375
MAEGQPDSLEGWVPLRGDLFAEPERHQLHFLVAWNDAEGKFAVTCHDRTAQRRRRRREGGPPGPGPAPPPSWAGLLSAAGLRGAHRQLAALWPPLERCFPRLPPELEARAGARAPGLWALLWPAPAGPGEAALRELCAHLERYLGEAAGGCGCATLRDALFPAEAATAAADCESPRALRERTLRAREAEARARLRQLLERHQEASTMVELMKVYQEEDAAYQELVTMATMFYQYLLQPFRDMREVATSCKLDILKSLEEDELGPKRRTALQEDAREWARRAEESVVCIQDITVNYFTETVEALAGMQKQMEQDQKRFGQAAWASATSRLEKLKLMLARETLQLMRAKELCLNHKAAAIQGKMEDLPEQEKSIDAIDELEIQYYEAQLELYEVKFNILKYEEILLIVQLDSIKRLIKEKEGEVVYYDTCESPKDLKAMEGALGLQEAGSALARQVERLQAQRGRICARRAQLRNRRDQCTENHRLRLQQAAESVKYFHQHHSIQMKRDKVKEEERKKKEWINQERQKTLQRLRVFKGKGPGQPGPKASCSGSGTAHPAREPAQRTPSPAPPTAPGACAPPRDSHGEAPAGPGGPASPRVSAPAGDQMRPPPPPPPLPALASPPQSSPRRSPAGTSGADGPLPLRCDAPAERPAEPSEGSAGPGSMDAVLASLRRAEPPWPAAPAHGPLSHPLLAAIRQGVKLKHIHPEAGRSRSRTPPSTLETSLRAALQRIRSVATDVEDGDQEQDPGEWGH